MKTAALIVVTLAVVVSSAEGNFFRMFYSLDPLVEEDAPECQGKAQSCIDCYTVRTCAKLPNYKPVANTTCPNNAPYCNDGQCVVNLPADSNCADGDTTSSTFQCNGDGYFPDPTDCTKYHFCVNDKATDYDCKMYPYTVYDQTSRQCRPKNEAQCYTFRCPANKVLRYQWYEPDNSIYGYCISQDVSQIQLSKCPENKRLNITDTVDPQCVPYCAQQGRFAHDSDTTKYYECGGKPGRLVGPILRGCPSGSQYDAKKQQCVIPSSDDTESSTSAPGSSSTTQASTGSSTTTQASDGSSTTTQASDGSSSTTQASDGSDTETSTTQ